MLSSYYNYSKHRNVLVAPLNDKDWISYFKNNQSPFEGDFLNIDKWAQEHLEKFWSNYNIPINF